MIGSPRLSLSLWGHVAQLALGCLCVDRFAAPLFTLLSLPLSEPRPAAPLVPPVTSVARHSKAGLQRLRMNLWPETLARSCLVWGYENTGCRHVCVYIRSSLLSRGHRSKGQGAWGHAQKPQHARASEAAAAGIRQRQPGYQCKGLAGAEGGPRAPGQADSRYEHAGAAPQWAPRGEAKKGYSSESKTRDPVG